MLNTWLSYVLLCVVDGFHFSLAVTLTSLLYCQGIDIGSLLFTANLSNSLAGKALLDIEILCGLENELVFSPSNNARV